MYIVYADYLGGIDPKKEAKIKSIIRKVPDTGCDADGIRDIQFMYIKSKSAVAAFLKLTSISFLENVELRKE
jgi:hypothetical protein